MPFTFILVLTFVNGIFFKSSHDSLNIAFTFFEVLTFFTALILAGEE